MPFIAKTAPLTIGLDDRVQVAERPFYGGKTIHPGAAIYLWSSETQGGTGLWARGTVVTVLPDDGKLALTVRVDQKIGTNRYGADHIAAYRDSASDTPTAGLARKLYKHAHNKIAQISEAEAALLLQQFG